MSSRLISSHTLKCYRAQQLLTWRSNFSEFIQFQSSRKFRMSSQGRFMATSYLFQRSILGRRMRFERILYTTITRRKPHFPSHFIVRHVTLLAVTISSSFEGFSTRMRSQSSSVMTSLYYLRGT